MEQVLEKLESETLSEVYFIAIALVLAFGALQATGTVMNTEKPVVSVVSCSMYPQLHVGDVLIVQGKSYDQIQEDDVIVYSVMEADITVEEDKYDLTRYNGGQTVDTSIGEIQLETVYGGQQNSASEALISVDGKNVRVREGRAYEVKGKKLEVNEIRGMNIPVVHRVIKRNATRVETKGDNNQAQLDFESNVKPEQIHGEVMFLVPRIGGLKLLVMDILGYSGPMDQPFKIDTYPQCSKRS